MSFPVTEIAYVQIKEGIDLESGEGKSIWDATLKTIASQKGFKRLSWGAQIENPGITQMAIGEWFHGIGYGHLVTYSVIDWESLDDHKAFAASDRYSPFLDRLKPILEGPSQLFHVKLPMPDHELMTSPFDAPVTECVSLYFSPTLDEASYNKSFSTFVAETSKVQGCGVTGLAGRWGVETHKLDGEDDEKKLFGAFLGWPSVESHMEFREMEDFPRLVRHLREGVDNAKMHHVAFKRFEG